MDAALGHLLGWPCPLSPHTLDGRATASSHSEHLMPCVPHGTGGSLRWGVLRPAPLARSTGLADAKEGEGPLLVPSGLEDELEVLEPDPGREAEVIPVGW